MIDIHHHLLPGIDDGSKDLAMSVAMVEMAVQEGITHIIATPHANDRYPYSREKSADLLELIRSALPADTASLIRLGLGCDFHMSWDNIEDARAHKRRYTLNETEYLLIELPDIGIPNRIDELLYEMRLGDLTPILTHPERNMTLQRDPNRLRAWVDAGLLVQVTAGSVTGGFGATAETVAWSYLNHNLVHFIATDAHNLEKRPPTMRAAHHLIGEILGHDTADRLCIANPLAVFEGRPMPPQPATHQAFLGEDEEEDKRPFWKRLLNRT